MSLLGGLAACNDAHEARRDEGDGQAGRKQEGVEADLQGPGQVHRPPAWPFLGRQHNLCNIQVSPLLTHLYIVIHILFKYIYSKIC